MKIRPTSLVNTDKRFVFVSYTYAKRIHLLQPDWLQSTLYLQHDSLQTIKPVFPLFYCMMSECINNLWIIKCRIKLQLTVIFHTYMNYSCIKIHILFCNYNFDQMSTEESLRICVITINEWMSFSSWTLRSSDTDSKAFCSNCSMSLLRMRHHNSIKSWGSRVLWHLRLDIEVIKKKKNWHSPNAVWTFSCDEPSSLHKDLLFVNYYPKSDFFSVKLVCMCSERSETLSSSQSSKYRQMALFNFPKGDIYERCADWWVRKMSCCRPSCFIILILRLRATNDKIPMTKWPLGGFYLSHLSWWVISRVAGRDLKPECTSFPYDDSDSSAHPCINKFMLVLVDFYLLQCCKVFWREDKLVIHNKSGVTANSCVTSPVSAVFTH